MKDDTFEKLNVTDSLAVVAELEHLRRHLLRSAQFVPEEDRLFYLVEASRCQKIRRDYMKKYFPVRQQDWCIVKSCATLRQLLYETTSSDFDTLQEVDNLIDEMMTKVTGKDLSDCESCRTDSIDAV